EVEVKLPAFRYPDGEKPALQDVSFKVREGETLGIVGRTGSGKTTLVNLLPRIFDPPEGTVFVGGYDVRSVRLQTLREAIAYVPQDGFLFSTTVGENIGFGVADATPAQIEQAARDACVYDDVAAFPQGFDTVIGERGVTLSGGQKQRTAIARAFLKDAPILILDDSLSAVDMNTEKAIIRRLQEVRRNKTTLIIAHRLSAVRHADQIIVLDEGRLVERGTHEQLLALGGIYAQMYALQEAGAPMEAATG
ncbi:MAG: ATP-binding cassette domain-containing protein, partial [Alicyclobacillus sp.]|nr:ATP-binding cassette domain-containing protein [Alicyclobacillus sp.]